jgi:3-hydroxymyristoyl/3-hydroxydecanoyl-(acyl carrier protein) dehydratase
MLLARAVDSCVIAGTARRVFAKLLAHLATQVAQGYSVVEPVGQVFYGCFAGDALLPGSLSQGAAALVSYFLAWLLFACGSQPYFAALAGLSCIVLLLFVWICNSQ